MSGVQKRAWFGLVITTTCVLAYMILVPFIGFLPACGAFGILGLLGFEICIGRKERSDERDISIEKRGVFIGFVASYMIFCIGCSVSVMIALFYLNIETIDVAIISRITFLALWGMYFIKCLATLILYGRQVEPSHG